MANKWEKEVPLCYSKEEEFWLGNLWRYLHGDTAEKIAESIQSRHATNGFVSVVDPVPIHFRGIDPLFWDPIGEVRCAELQLDTILKLKI